jgi:predicted RNA-binding protein
MCEFKVVIDGKVVFEDAVYVKADGGNVVVRDLLGKSKEFENCIILEVNVNSEHLLLASVKTGHTPK